MGILLSLIVIDVNEDLVDFVLSDTTGLIVCITLFGKLKLYTIMGEEIRSIWLIDHIPSLVNSLAVSRAVQRDDALCIHVQCSLNTGEQSKYYVVEKLSSLEFDFKAGPSIYELPCAHQVQGKSLASLDILPNTVGNYLRAFL